MTWVIDAILAAVLVGLVWLGAKLKAVRISLPHLI